MNRLPARPLPLVLALSLAFGAAMAQAQTGIAPVPASAATAQPIRIAAQPLAQALNDWARQTRLQVVVQQALVAGRSAPAVAGQLTARQALEQLLEGSGLWGRFEGALVTVEARPLTVGADATLQTVTVTAAGLNDGVTEGSGSYRARNSSTATRLGLSLRDTPQTVTVVTRQKMDDFSLATVENVLESTSGIFIQRQGGDGAQYYSRGFRLQSQYDGMPNPLGIGEDNFGPTPDSAFLDRVEILQGASGLLSGAGEPGGTINLVRKRPTHQFQAQGEVQLGSWGKKRLVADVGGPLVESGAIRGRVVALVDHADSFTDYMFDNRQGLYGIVEADVTPTTTLGASVTYQRNKFNSHYGVPMAPDGSDLRLPRSSFFGVWNGDSTRDSVSYTVSVDQKLPADWRLRAAYTHAEVDVDGVSNYIGGVLDVATGNGLRIWRALQQREFSSDVADLYATGPFDLLGRRHELVLGASSARMKYRNRLGNYVGTFINAYGFDATTVGRPQGPFPDWPERDTTSQHGLYGVARLNLTDALKLVLGARATWYEYKEAGVTRQKERGEISPYAGLVYALDDRFSLYASYSDIFKPQSSLTAAGSPVDPVVGKNYEAGIKGELLQGRLNVSASVFRLEQTNLAEVDPSVPFNAGNVCGGFCYLPAGLVVSRGLDLGVSGELAAGWQVGAGYTYVDSRYASGTLDGSPFVTYAPDHILRAYTTYRIPGSGWTVGGNVRVQSTIYGQDVGYRIEQGSYAVVGLMARYQITPRTELGFVVNNLFDRRYYDSVGSYSTKLENIYGAPRNLAVTLRHTF